MSRELDPGADRRQARLVEEERVRQADRGAGDVGVARARPEDGPQFRVLRPAGGAEEAQPQLRTELEPLAPGRLKGVADREGGVGRGVRRVRTAAVEDTAGRPFAAVGAVEGEVLAVDVEEDRADVQFGAAVDVWDRLGLRMDLGGFGVDEERDADDDIAEVEGPGDGRGDDDG